MLHPELMPLVTEDWDWSGKHTRLKYQMFVTTIFLFVVSKYTLKDFKVPFANISIVEQVNQRSLFFIILGFWIFSIIAFLVRTVREAKNIEEIKGRFNEVFENSISRTERMEKRLEDYSVSTDIERLTELLQSYVGSIENLSDEIPSISKKFEKLFAQKFVDKVEKGAIGDIQYFSLFEKAVYSQVKNLYENLQAEVSNPYSRPNNNEKEKRFIQLTELIKSHDAELKKFMSDNRQLVNSAVSMGKAPQELKITRSFVKKSLEELNTLDSKLDKGVLEVLRESNSQLSAQRIELQNAYNLVKGLRGWIGFDRILLSVIVPTLSCVILAVVSLYCFFNVTHNAIKPLAMLGV